MPKAYTSVQAFISAQRDFRLATTASAERATATTLSLLALALLLLAGLLVEATDLKVLEDALAGHSALEDAHRAIHTATLDNNLKGTELFLCVVLHVLSSS